MTSRAPQALLLVGPVGSGKTTVLLEVGKVLDHQGAPNALIDLDWLAWVSPSPASGASVGDILAANLAAVTRTFLDAGVERLVLARYLRSPGEVGAVRAAVGIPLTVIELSAPTAVLEQRVRARDTGRELTEHLAELTAGTGTGLGDTVVASGERPAADIAADVLAAAGWFERREPGS
jgi:ribose 1,5-bisphosphokinase PhnN